MRTLNVALVGLGNVGKAVARLFDRNAANFSRRLGVDLRLAWVCDRHPEAKLKGVRLKDRPRITKDFETILKDSSVDIVIELIGGRTEARRLVLGALAAGKRVITANKQLLAHEWNRVFETAARHKTQVAFEGSVAGAVPVLQALRTGLAANDISQLVGILNGTTNFILSQMSQKKWTFEEALKEAQACGMAERDPTLDLNGSDTAAKVSILASLLSGGWVKPAAVRREGITAVSLEDLEFADAELGRTVRLLGVLRFDWSKKPVQLSATVQPTLVPLEHPLAAVHGGYNAVMVQASAAQDLLFYGLGAGPEPAASAVLSDLFAVTQELTLGAGSLGLAAGGGRPRIVEDAKLAAFYLRLNAADRPGVLAAVTGALGKQKISIAQIFQTGAKSRGKVPIHIVTHSVTRKQIDAARAVISRLPAIAGKTACIPFL